MKASKPPISTLGLFALFAFLLAVFAGAGAEVKAQEFTLRTSASNVISSKASIARPGLDGNPEAIIVATPVGDTARSNPHPIGAWYYNGKWNIFNTDHAAMPSGLVYKVQAFAEPGPNRFLHVVTYDNLSAASSYIDNPAINGNPNVQLVILQNHAPDARAYNLNANEARATYNAASGKWSIANVNGKPLYPNTAYNVYVAGGVPDDSIRPVDRVKDPSVRPIDGVGDPSIRPLPVPTRTREQHEVKPTQPEKPTALSPQPGATCTNEMAWQTVGKWGRQKVDDLAMADRTFPKTAYKAVLAKAQEVIDLFKQATPEFAGIEADAYRSIRGQSIVPNGPLPFRVDVTYRSFICVGNDTYKADMRGKVIVYGNYGVTTVSFNGLSDILESAQDGSPLTTSDGEEIFQYNKDLGEFRGFPLIQTSGRDSYHEAVVIAQNSRLPFKPVSREQYIRARIKSYESGTGMRDAIAILNGALGNLSPAERQSPALVRDVTATSRLFASEAEGGRHLVTIDKSYFKAGIPRDKIQLIIVHWHSSPADRPKLKMLETFKKNFDFLALSGMLGK